MAGRWAALHEHDYVQLARFEPLDGDGGCDGGQGRDRPENKIRGRCKSESLDNGGNISDGSEAKSGKVASNFTALPVTMEADEAVWYNLRRLGTRDAFSNI
jgi:hypothetical protein